MTWETWNVRSVLAHVSMPDAFGLQLGLFEPAQCKYLREALIGRPPTPDDRRVSTANDLVGIEDVHSAERWIDGRVTDLRISWNGLRFRVRSAQDGEDLVLLVEPEELRRGQHLLSVEAGVLWNRPGGSERQGDQLRLFNAERAVSIHSTSAPAGPPLFPATGAHLSIPLDGPVGISTGRARSLDEIRNLIDGAAETLDQRLHEYGENRHLAGAMASALGWTTIWNPVDEGLLTVISRVWCSRNGGTMVFCWDSYFAAMMAAALGDHDLAVDNWDVVSQPIAEHGCVPNVRNVTGAGTWQQSQPPVGSMSLRYLADHCGEEVLSAARIDALLRWNQWWVEHRERDGYLVWGSEQGPNRNDSSYETEASGNLQGARFESGLDNYPLFDDAGWDGERGQMMQADVGLMSLYIRDCDELAALCQRVGRSEDAQRLHERAERFATALDQLWDDDSGIYRNRDLDERQAFVPRRGMTLFYPLLTGRVPAARVRRMLDGHLLDPDAFWGDYPVPSIAKDDPAFHDQSYWRGRVWAPSNLLIYWGLKQVGEHAVATEMADKGNALFLRNWQEHGYVAENYSGVDGRGGERGNSDPFNPWGALLALIGLCDAGQAPGLTVLPQGVEVDR